MHHHYTRVFIYKCCIPWTLICDCRTAVASCYWTLQQEHRKKDLYIDVSLYLVVTWQSRTYTVSWQQHVSGHPSCMSWRVPFSLSANGAALHACTEHWCVSDAGSMHICISWGGGASSIIVNTARTCIIMHTRLLGPTTLYVITANTLNKQLDLWCIWSHK